MARLDEICLLNMGQSPDSSTYNEDGEGMPFFQGNADFGEINPKIRVWCTEPTKIANVGDILISVRAPIGALNIANTKCCIGRGLAALTVKEDLCAKEYLWHAIKSKVDELNSKGTGSTFKAINKNILAETNLPLYSLKEQKEIANIFDKMDELISCRKEQLEKLDELVKARFVEMFGTFKNNHQRYPVVKIGECAKLQGGFAFKSSDYLTNGIRLVQISNVNKDTLDWDSINCVPQIFLQKYKDFELHVGDLVLAMTRPVIKSLDAVKIATVSEADVPSLLNQRVGRFVIDRTMLNSVYLMLCCQMAEFREYVEAMSGNSLQPNISSKQVEDYCIVLPPIELQNQFAAFVEQTEKTKAEVQKSLDELEILKKSLMQKYFE
ncbi:MAG: restriction endonuclease subunit S [Oscillospiraceae bacterium]|nr:restriction endonuclease subunit S [Oscillospiraceae bacterium]